MANEKRASGQQQQQLLKASGATNSTELPINSTNNSSIGLLKVTRNAKTGDFEVSHGHPGDEETSLNRIWRVVGNRND